MVSVSDAERKYFVRNGFLILRGYFTEDEANFIRSVSDQLGHDAKKILENAVVIGKSSAELAAANKESLIVVPEAANPKQVCRFEYILGSHEAMREFALRRIRPVIESLGGESFTPFKDKENEKHPGGGAFPPHQDFAAYQHFGPRYEITAKVTVDPCTIKNGCLYFAEEWQSTFNHNLETVEEVFNGRPLLRFYKGGAKNGDIDESITRGFRWLAVETKPTDLVLFDSFAPHMSYKNDSLGSRRIMLLTFAPTRDGEWYGKYYDDKRANFSDPKFHVSTPTYHAAKLASKM